MEVGRLLRKYLLCVLVVPVLMAVILTACGKAEDTPQFDSGVTNQNYQGVVKPVVQKKMKLSSEEVANGIQKTPLKSSLGQQLTPVVQVTDSVGKDKEGQVKDDNAAKPQI